MQQCLPSDGISQAQIEQIGSWLELHPCQSEDKLQSLIKQYPGLIFTLCSEDDLGFHQPFRCFSYFDLLLVKHNLQGCSSLTSEPEMCSGLVIALHEA